MSKMKMNFMKLIKNKKNQLISMITIHQVKFYKDLHKKNLIKLINLTQNGKIINIKKTKKHLNYSRVVNKKI